MGGRPQRLTIGPQALPPYIFDFFLIRSERARTPAISNRPREHSLAAHPQSEPTLNNCIFSIVYACFLLLSTPSAKTQFNSLQPFAPEWLIVGNQIANGDSLKS
jgi:hypothetical protein